MFTLPGMVAHAFKPSTQTETWSQNGEGGGEGGEGGREEGFKVGREGIFTLGQS